MGVGAKIGTIVVACAAATTGARAQPAPAVDYAKASERYRDGEAAMAEARYADAIDAYGAAYEITHDAVLFFKIGVAHEKAGACPAAVVYLRRYLKEAHPAEPFVARTHEHLAACHGDDPPPAPPPAPDDAPPPPPPLPRAPASIAPIAPVTPAPAPPAPHAHGARTGWLLIGGAATFVTLGGVLAYAARSSEADVRDLYAGLGKTPAYDAATAQRYHDLLDAGYRYEHLAWAAFGLAGACAIAAATVFALAEDRPGAIVVTPTGTGVSARVRF